jgi:RNA recognition motif-containing protein
MRDSATGRSRGFGFLTFRDPKTVNTVMVKEHYLDGKIVSITISSLGDFLFLVASMACADMSED